MSTNWYWAQDGEQHGPLPEDELRERFLGGELPGDTLVWSDGMAGWAPATRVPGLTETPPIAPPPPPPKLAQPSIAPAAAGAPSMPSMQGVRAGATVATRRAWSRFGARFVDLNLASALAISLIGVPDLANTMQVLATTLIGCLMWVFIEPLFLSRNGMTPGKWLFRVRIVHSENRFLTYREGLKRTVQVLTTGMGLGLPIISLVMLAIAYRELTVTGATPWDRSAGVEVQHGVMGSTQKAVLAIIVMIVLLSMLSQPAAG
jgi:hypothetical protein